VTADELREWRKSQGLTQKEVAAILNEPLGRKYNGVTIGRWESGRNPIPRPVLDYLAGNGAAPARAPDDPGGDSAAAAPPGEDLPPRAQPDSNRPALVPAVSGGEYAKACEDLWDMVGFGLVAAGTGLGKPALKNDGYLICGWEDASGKHEGLKRELGVAYGKLAERNRTFQRIVLAMSQESVWAEVIIVTGKLAQQMYANHMRYATLEAQRKAPARAVREEHVEEHFDGRTEAA
jgi:transcriptional regulator with XRE-family HTH domain